MRLSSFAVSGYKNLQRQVQLTHLGALNVIHGTNNVGKSNLVEAIGLFFASLRLLNTPSAADPYTRHRPSDLSTEDSAPPALVAPPAPSRTIRHDAMVAAGFSPKDIFARQTPDLIRLKAELAFQGTLPAELGEDGESSSCQVELSMIKSEIRIRLVHLAVGKTVLIDPGQEPDVRWSSWLEHLNLQRGFQLIQVDRTLAYTETNAEHGKAYSQRDLIPADLCLRLWDAREADDAEWQLFQSATEAFGDLIPGAVDVKYDRRSGTAQLFAGKLESYLLGSGTQQILTLLGRLVMSVAPILGVEEPEINLSYEMQIRLLDALRRLTKQEHPAQLFLTSHSNAFEEPSPGAFFYGLVPGKGGPAVQRRASGEAAEFLGLQPMLRPNRDRAPVSYVTREGLVLIPDQIREFLRLQHGGGVLFERQEETGYVRMLTNQQFLALLEPDHDVSTEEG